MPTWLVIIPVVAAIGAVIGYFGNEYGNPLEGAIEGAIGGALGCGFILVRLLLWGLGLGFFFWLFCAIFT